jgi:hypothetical protein
MMTPEKRSETVAALGGLLAELETMSPLNLVNGGAKNLLKRAVGISGDLMREAETRLAALEAAVASLISNGPQA